MIVVLTRILKWLFSLVIIAVLLIGGGAAYWRHQLNSPIAIHSPYVYEVHPGDGIRASLLRLQSEGVIKYQWPLKVLGVVNPQALRSLKVGEFRLTPGMSLVQMIHKLSSNDVVTYHVTVPEGRTFGEMRSLLDHAQKLKVLTAGMSDSDFMKKIGHPGEQPEGRFFPATYRYTKGMTDVQLYQQAYDLMQKNLASVWKDRAPDLPYDSPYQALTMASLIEEEAARSSERTKISGVFVRRLEKGMRLQTDPSVVYGLHLQNGNELTRKDLAKPTPYNTYVIKGLPPTPIALPGLPSLEAAVHPADGDALYFVAMGNGYHAFSSSLEQHDAAIREYILHHATHSSKPDQSKNDHQLDESVIDMSEVLSGKHENAPTDKDSVEESGSESGQKDSSPNESESHQDNDNDNDNDQDKATADKNALKSDQHHQANTNADTDSEDQSHTASHRFDALSSYFSCDEKGQESPSSKEAKSHHKSEKQMLSSSAVCSMTVWPKQEGKSDSTKDPAHSNEHADTVSSSVITLAEKLQSHKTKAFKHTSHKQNHSNSHDRQEHYHE